MSGIEGINNGAAQVHQEPVFRGYAGEAHENGSADSGSLLFAGSLNLPQAPADKIGTARKHAMKLVMDAFDNEKQVDRSLSELRESRSEAESDLAWRREDVKKLKDRVTQYAKDNGITEDSREQKDLDIIRRMRDYRKEDPIAAMTDPLGCLSEDERDRYGYLMDHGLTEYQRLALDTYDEISMSNSEIERDKQMIRAYNQSITDINIDRLKDQSMMKAQKGKDEIMQAASKDVISSLVQDAVENITEEQEQVKEDAEEKAEIQDGEKEKAEKREEEKKEREILEAEAELKRQSSQYVSSDSQAQVNSEIQNILNKLSLLEEDIKGIEVNKQL